MILSHFPISTMPRKRLMMAWISSAVGQRKWGYAEKRVARTANPVRSDSKIQGPPFPRHPYITPNCTLPAGCH